MVGGKADPSFVAVEPKVASDMTPKVIDPIIFHRPEIMSSEKPKNFHSQILSSKLTGSDQGMNGTLSKLRCGFGSKCEVLSELWASCWTASSTGRPNSARNLLHSPTPSDHKRTSACEYRQWRQPERTYDNHWARTFYHHSFNNRATYHFWLASLSQFSIKLSSN